MNHKSTSTEAMQENVDSQDDVSPFKQYIHYKGETYEVSEAVNDIITDSSGTELYSTFLNKEDVYKLINVKTKEEISLRGDEITYAFHAGIMSLLDGQSKISAIKEKMEEPPKKKGKNKKNVKSKNEKEVFQNEGLTEEGELGACPSCGAPLSISWLSERAKEQKEKKKKYSMKCKSCGKKVMMLRERPISL